MRKFLNNRMVRSLFLSAAISTSVLFSVAPVSCKMTDEGVEVTPVVESSPHIESFSLRDTNSVYVACSQKVDFSEIAVFENSDDSGTESETNAEKTVYATAVDYSYDDDKCGATITLSAPTVTGKNYILEGIVSDEQGNSLEFSRNFSGFNAKPARLVLNEVRASYIKDKTVAEYVELFVLKGGNLSGLEIVSGKYGEEKKYVFPGIDVKRGEYITVHYRTFGTEGEVDELGENLAEAGAKDCCNSGRDLWRKKSDKALTHNDVIVLRNTAENTIEDALLLCATGESLKKPLQTELVDTVLKSGLWSSDDMLCSDGLKGGTSEYRSASRQNTEMLAKTYSVGTEIPAVLPVSASDWIVTDKTGGGSNTVSGATPGYTNSSHSYINK